ncbi:acyl carrier protein [Paenibacillus sp. KN14-4R]|uniref:acyl carrier protein n=1 Tax=Paenibacillus sp. KN14-4R TaxID=3445773 RepID=UPI003FA09DA2
MSTIVGRSLSENEAMLLIEDYNLDSISFIELIVGMEKQFGFVIPAEDYRIELYATLGLTIDYILRRTSIE